MKNFSSALLAYLQNPATRECYRADLFEITLNSGAVMRTTSGQMDIQYAGNWYSAQNFGKWSRDTITTAIGTGSNSTRITIIDNDVQATTLTDNAQLYKIASALNSAKVLDIPGDSQATGVNPQIFDDNGSVQQKWQIIPVDGQWVKLQNFGSSLVLDITNGSTSPGGLIQQYRSNGFPQQQWQVVSVSGGFVKFVSKLDGQVIDLISSNTTNGTHIQQYTDGGSANQHWQIVPLPSTTVTQGLYAAISQGYFDGAYLTVYGAYMPTYGDTSLGVETKFAGVMGQISKLGRTSCELEVHDLNYLLNLQMPRNLLTSGCRHVLYDQNCTIDPTAYAEGYTVASGSTNLAINLSSASSHSAPYFDQGIMTCTTSGPNRGLSQTIRTQLSTSSVQIMRPFLFPLSVGDHITLYPGCDKTLSTCANKFSNQIHFGGVPRCPSPETVL